MRFQYKMKWTELILTIRMLLIFIIALIVGCTPKVIKMDDATKGSLSRAQQITAIHYIHPVFEMPSYSTSGGAIGGLISGIIARSQGERLEEKFGLHDPILHVKEKFLSTVLNEFPSLKISQMSAPLENDDVHDLKGQFSKGYILDFQTRRWGIVKHIEGWEYLKPSGSDRRKAKFLGRARLIDPSKKSILWQGICDLEDSNIFTMEDVKYWYPGEDNNLEGLFKILGFRCVKELVEQFTNTLPSQ